MLSVAQLLGPIRAAISTKPLHNHQSHLSPPSLFSLSTSVTVTEEAPLSHPSTPCNLFTSTPASNQSNSNSPSPSTRSAFSSSHKSVSASASISKKTKYKGPWRPYETKLLARLVQEHGARKWTHIAAFIPGRTAKQARERYKNHLDPSLKKGAPWTPEEDAILMNTIRAIGKKWASTSKKLSGRSDNDVKNRYKSITRSAAKTIGRKSSSKSRYNYHCNAPINNINTFVPRYLRWYEDTLSNPPTMFNIYEKFSHSISSSS